MTNFSNLLVLKFGDVEYHAFHINEFRKLFKSVHIIDYDSYFNQHGIRGTENHISDYIDREKINLIIVWLFINNYELSIEFLNSLRKRAYVVFWFFDDEVFFHSFNKFYAQIADAVVTTSYYDRFSYEQLDIPAVLYFSAYSKHDYYPMDVKKTIDVSFVGIYYGRPERSDYIDYLKNKGIMISTYGSGFDGGYISQQKMNEIFSQSKINLNFTQLYQALELYQDNPLLPRIRQNKGRPIEIALTKSFCLSQYAPPLDKLFEIDKEIAVFDTKEQLLDKVLYYLHHSRERERIAANAYKRALRNYESGVYFKKVFNELFEKLRNNQGRRFLYNKIYYNTAFENNRIKYFHQYLNEQLSKRNMDSVKESLAVIRNKKNRLFIASITIKIVLRTFLLLIIKKRDSIKSFLIKDRVSLC